jgi:hypothetical protein
MPDTTSSGRRGSSFTIARFTQSAGVPSTEYVFSSICSTRSGCLRVSDCAQALTSRSGATTYTSPCADSAVAAPDAGAETPSSLVTRIRG